MNRELIVGVTSASAGVVAGYFLGRKLAARMFEDRLDQEIQETKEFYAKVYKRDDYETAESAAEMLGINVNLEPAVEALRKYQGQGFDEFHEEVQHPTSIDELTEVSEEDGLIEQNIFEKDSTAQLAVDSRTPNVPYVISLEEFMQNEPEHNQITVTYYEGDDTLADERDDIIEDINDVVGRANLSLFGLASSDPNIVHIRHELRKIDFEVVKSTGEYRREVAGFTDEDALKHSEDSRMRRRRPRWDE